MKLSSLRNKLLPLLASSFGRNSFFCNICLSRSSAYVNKWSDLICGCCGSTIRSRLLVAATQHIRQLSYHNLFWFKDILHVAPEHELRTFFSQSCNVYQSVDKNPGAYTGCKYIDLMQVNESLYSSSSIDAVIALDVFEHLPRIIPALSEVIRLLRPSGCFIFSVPDVWSIDRIIELQPLMELTSKNTSKFAGVNGHLRLFPSDISLFLDPFFESVHRITASSLPSCAVKSHRLVPDPMPLNIHATRDRSIYFCFKPRNSFSVPRNYLSDWRSTPLIR